MQSNVTNAIAEGYHIMSTAAEDFGNWRPIKPEDHPNQKLLVPDQSQFVVTRQINKPGWGSCRFKIKANSGPEAGKIMAAYAGAIYTEKPDKDDRALIAEARKARI